MIPAYRRWLRHVRNIVIFLIVLWGITSVYAAMFPVAVNQSSLPHTLSPADTTRNFFSVFPGILGTVIPEVFSVIFVIGVGLLQFVGIFWYMSRGRTYTLLPGEYNQRFSDVRGQPEIVASTKQVMALFQGQRDFMDRFGGYPPRGLLFEGPPGTGKTLLAKAIAGESGVPFIYASGAGFANMFIGVGNMRINRMFTRARKYAQRWGGCVIFLDELDSIGGARQGVSHASHVANTLKMVMPGGGGGGDSSLVNELLTQLDGIDLPPRFSRAWRRIFHRPPGKAKAHNILLVGATNRAGTLDPALLRPGRFDRKIHVGVPTEDGRRDIIGYYLAKVAHVPIDIDRLAKATRGYSPASIKMLINEALVFARRGDRDALTYDDIWQAKLHDEVGLVEPVIYSEIEKRITAIHEAGHAVTMHFLDKNREVQIVTVRKRGDTLGLVHSQEAEERFSVQREDIIAGIQVSLAGMVAEEIWLGQSSSGPSSDLRAATGRAIQMIGYYGMGSGLASHMVLDGHSNSDDSITLALRDPELRAEVNALLRECKESTRTFLEEHRRALEVIRDALLERDELTGDEFRLLLYESGMIPTPRPAMIPFPIMAPAAHAR
jgi:cell division protease FtsH